MSKKDILYVMFALLVSSSVFLVGYKKISTPEEVYRVYLKGDTIGYIKDKSLLEEYIDNEQSEIKNKYKIDKVYLPNDLDIVKEVTYNHKISSEEEIYDKVKNIAPFTISGYTVTIKGVKVQDENTGKKVMLPDVKIYVIDKNTFTDALKKTIQVFVPEKDYENFINKTQPALKNVGSIIEDIYIQNQITIAEGRISAEEKIFTSVEELNKYLLFGTTGEQKKYKVKAGDSISDIAFKNKLSVQEFLIANPEFTSEDNLLYEGQIVNLGLINPVFRLVEEDHVVELQTQKYDTKIEYDESMLKGYEKVTQNGSNGTLKLTKKVQKVNGSVENVVTTKTDVIKQAVPKIIVRGSKVVPNVGNVGLWKWPASEPSCVTSPFGWRWGKFHSAVDISCSGYGSPVYAANNGTVEVADNTSPWPNGNYIVINHNNGYYTIYAHLASVKVSAGQVVTMGQVIGTMGHSGYATGTHLHFGISTGFPDKGGQYYNPMDFY